MPRERGVPHLGTSQAPETVTGYVTWDDKSHASRERAIAESSKSIDDYQSIQRTEGFQNQNFVHIDRDVSVRTGFTRQDYEYFRPGETIPKKDIDIMRVCMAAYEKNGLIHNVIDLMGDFACQGIELVHPNPQIQKFYRQWFKRVRGRDRSERFLNLLYRCGNVIVKRATAKMRVDDMRRLKRTIAEPDIEPEDPIKVGKNELPYTYSFLNPLNLEIVGEEISTFVGEFFYALKIPPGMIARVTRPQNEVERRLVAKIPADIRQAILAGQRTLVLNPDKISAYHYKKDDWQKWAYPLHYAILDDLLILEKTKLADLAALDGAISQVRLWRLGSLEHKIMPKPASVSKLASILMNNVAGGVVDLIWGPELDFKESASTAHQFLGPEKYEAVYTSIYQGLGIPPTLTGAATASGFTNNYISLKTLIERLNYGRQVLISFWEKEIELVQRAMGFRVPAQLRFDRMTLSDETHEKGLLMDLADRGIVSLETVLDRFEEDYDIEKYRMAREERDRNNGRLPERAGPFYKSQTEFEMRKIALQRGNVAPSEVGLDLKERKPGEKSPQEMMMEQKKIADKQKGQSGQGRPLNKQDSGKRKTKTVKPRTSANAFVSVLIWASDAQEKISQLMNPELLQVYGKKNMRSLTTAQAEEAEMIKFSVLSNIEPFVPITTEVIAEIVTRTDFAMSAFASELYKEMNKQFTEKNGTQPSTEDCRKMQASVYALLHEEEVECPTL